MLDLILIVLCSIIGIFIFIRFFKWGIKCFSDDEIMDNFGFKDIICSLLFLFWLILIGIGLSNILFYRNNIFTPEILNAISKMNINVDALIKNLPILILMILSVIFMIFIIPIICLVHYHKHKKNLKEENVKNYKKIAKTHFLMGLTSPVLIPLLLGPKILIGLISSGDTKTKERFTKSYTKITDSKGNTTYVDTIIDNETGYGSTKIENSKGEKSYHTTYKD